MPKTYKGGSTFARAVTDVPNSCIEAAELIVQVSNSTIDVTWNKAGELRTPHVWAEFKSHIVNISKTSNFHNKITSAVESYPFGTSLPADKEGICLLNKGRDNNGYNMHFGAVVRSARGRVELSNMNEPSSAKVDLALLETMTITNVDDFRSGGYENKDKFVLGKLTISPDTSKTELK